MTFYRKHDSYKAEAMPPSAYSYKPGMPLLHGHYVALEYVPKQHLPSMLEQWRVWCKAHPRSEWPRHVTDFAEQLKRDGKRSELLSLHVGEV